MNQENGYLSDEQLNELMMQVELEEMISAPPDMKENILKAVDIKKRNPQKEYRQYCFHVCLSAAAAIMLIFLLPELKNLTIFEEMKEWKEEKSYEAYQEEIPSRDEVLARIGIGNGFFDNAQKWHIGDFTSRLEFME